MDDGNRALFSNGLPRFPLVLLYCFIGAGLAVYAAGAPEFLDSLPRSGGAPNYNLAVPLYLIQQLPTGVVGIALVVGYTMSLLGTSGPKQALTGLVWSKARYQQFGFVVNWIPRMAFLLGYFVILLGTLILL